MADVSTYITTFNCARKPIDVDYFAANLFNGLKADIPPDLVVLCLQEIAPLGYSFLGGSLLTPYLDRFTEALPLATARSFGTGSDNSYVSVITRNVGMTAIMVFGKHHVAHRIHWMQTAGVGVGAYWEMGNKGAVGVRMGLHSDDSSELAVLTFVAAHLAPFERDWKRRNEDWRSICERLVFESTAEKGAAGRPDTSEAEAEPLLSSADGERADEERHTASLFSPPSHVFFAGDLNYRTSDNPPSPSDFDQWPQPVESDSDPRHHLHFLSKDQLTRERTSGATLHLLAEAPIDFPPTYKYSNAAQKHVACSEIIAAQKTLGDGRMVKTTQVRAPTEEVWLWAKHRTPSWCDRVLFLEAATPKVHLYTALPIQPTSDHRPVALLCSVPVKPITASLSAPYQISKDWKDRRAVARRYEILIGLAAYFGWTWEGEALLAGTIVGIVGGFLVLRALLGLTT